MDLTRTIIAVLVALGIGAGGGLYYLDGSEVPPKDLDVICAEWKPPIITCENAGAICVTNSMEIKDKGIKLSIDGSIELTNELGEKETFTKQQILNLKALEVK